MASQTDTQKRVLQYSGNATPIRIYNDVPPGGTGGDSTVQNSPGNGTSTTATPITIRQSSPPPPAPTGKTMSYPSDYEAKSGQWFILHEYRYTRSTQDAVLKGKLTGNVIQLPMPPSLNNNYNANWATTELGAFGNAVLNTNSFNGNLNSALDQFKQNKNASVWDAADSIASMLGSDAADLALAGVGDAITSSRLGQTAFGLGGVARNPFIATLYEGPDLRSFRFDYTFFPKSLQEAITLKEIETTLAKGMHPSFNAVFGNYLFDYPFMYKPEFSDASGLFKFKMCIIKNLSMQYHAGGVPIYFDANSSKIPSFITMGFEICENEVITQEWFS